MEEFPRPGLWFVSQGPDDLDDLLLASDAVVHSGGLPAQFALRCVSVGRPLLGLAKQRTSAAYAVLEGLDSSFLVAGSIR